MWDVYTIEWQAAERGAVQKMRLYLSGLSEGEAEAVAKRVAAERDEEVIMRERPPA